MTSVRVNWNLGMLVALALLVAGGAMTVASGPEGGALSTAGLGVVILAGVVYLASRLWMILKERRR